MYITTCENCKANNAAAGVPDTPENVAHYVGEAARSPAERAAEHLQDLKDKKEESHMWAHKLLADPEEEDVSFSMKVVKKHTSAFQRQVMEAVLIEVRQNDYILNSRSGYNRCLIPRLSVSVGDRVQEEVVKTRSGAKATAPRRQPRIKRVGKRPEHNKSGRNIKATERKQSLTEALIRRGPPESEAGRPILQAHKAPRTPKIQKRRRQKCGTPNTGDLWKIRREIARQGHAVKVLVVTGK